MGTEDRQCFWAPGTTGIRASAPSPDTVAGRRQHRGQRIGAAARGWEAPGCGGRLPRARLSTSCHGAPQTLLVSPSTSRVSSTPPRRRCGRRNNILPEYGRCGIETGGGVTRRWRIQHPPEQKDHRPRAAGASMLPQLPGRGTRTWIYPGCSRG